MKKEFLLTLLIFLGGQIVANKCFAQIGNFKTPQSIKDKYKYLYDLKIIKNHDGSLQFQNGRLWKREGINVLYLKGDKFEMAFQHGMLLKDEIADGALVQAGKIAENSIINNLGEGLPANIVNKYTSIFILEKMLKYSLNQSTDNSGLRILEAYGLSEASGVSVKTIIYAALGPEAAQVLLGKTDKDTSSAPSTSSCTDFAAWEGATDSGEMIIGRNTDYPLNGYFEKHPTVIYFNPTDGGQKYMTVTSAGFHNSGVLGYNESGIYIGVHTVPTVDVSAKGFPVFMIGQEILRNAHNMDEVLQLLKKVHPAAGWSYHIISSKERRAIRAEMSNSKMKIIKANRNYFITTNHWQDMEMQSIYLHINNTVDLDTIARMRRAEKLIKDSIEQGGLTYIGAMKILADKFDPINNIVRSFPYTIAVGSSVSSIVLLPDNNKIFVGNGFAPTSQNTFVSFPTVDVFNPDDFAQYSSETVLNDQYVQEYKNQHLAEQEYIKARKAFEYSNDSFAAICFINQAIQLDPDNPAFYLVKGILQIRIGDLSNAKLSLEKVMSFNYDRQRIIVAKYAHARILAATGDIDNAVDEFKEILDSVYADKKLKDISLLLLLKFSKTPAAPLGPITIAPMLTHADAFRYRGMIRP